MNKAIQVKHITDEEMIAACRAFRTRTAPTPDVALADRYPVKVILAKMKQMVDRNILEYGVSLRTAWVIGDIK